MSNDVKDYSQAIKQVTKTANSELPLKKVLGSIAKSIAKALQADGCTIMLLTPSRKYLTPIAAHGLSELYIRKGAVNALKSLPDVMNGKIVYIKDVSKGKDVQYPEAASQEKIKGVIGVPLMRKGEIFGELRVYIPHIMQFDSSIKDFLTSVAGIISFIAGDYSANNKLGSRSEMPASVVREQAKSIGSGDSAIRPVNFGHPSEEQFAHLLDFYRIEWLYEPRSFPLEWEGKRLLEMFTPDFYLPELNLYIELTTSKQSLITEKNRKIRLLKELYPEVNIKLLNKNDYIKMLEKYGYSNLGIDEMKGITRVLFNHTQIQHRVRALANNIVQDYSGEKLVMIGVLKGVICFISDLMRNIALPLNIDFMAVSYYGTDADQPVKITKDLDICIKDKHVLMVEDIVDTGMTLNYILNHLNSSKPASLKVCTLLDKKVRRLIDVPLDYVGFEIPDEFVVGYGLDYNGEYRNLPFIGIMHSGK